MASQPIQHNEDDEISVKELILNLQGWAKYLWSKWFFLLVAGVLGGILGLGYSWLSKPQYTATTTFVLEGGEAKGLSQYAGMAAMVGIDLGGGSGGLFQGDNILELYKSRNMIAQTLLSTSPDSSELLVERYIRFNELNKAWADDPELSKLDFRKASAALDARSLRVRDSVMTTFVSSIKEDNLTVEKPDKTLSIIQVNVTSPDEIFSKSFNEQLVQQVNDFYIQTKTKKFTSNIAMLQAKVDSVRSVMEGAIYSAAQVSDATPNINPTRQVQRAAPVQEAQFSAEANRAILSQLLQNLELTKMNLMQEQPLIQLVDYPVLPLKVEQIGKAKGIIVGGFIFGVLALLFIVGRKWYGDVMNE